MQQTLRYLGWNSLQIQVGVATADSVVWSQIPLDWRPEGIRNLSYAAQADEIGITAEDKTHGEQVIAVYSRATGTTRVLKRRDYVLQHAVDGAAQRTVYTRPSAQRGTADMYLLAGDAERLILEGRVAQDAIPAWFPDNIRVAYHTPEGEVAVTDTSTTTAETRTNGRSPAVHPDGGQIAFQRDNRLYLWDETSRTEHPLPGSESIGKHTLLNGLSWSPDGRFLAFGTVTGWTGKESAFYQMDVTNGQTTPLCGKYLSGVLILGAAG